MDTVQYRTTYRQPVTTQAQVAHTRVRSAIADAMETLLDVVPEGRERALALTKLEEAMFWGNAGVARQMGSEGGKEKAA